MAVAKRTTAAPAVVPAHTLDRKTFGRRLRSARKKFGWTLAEVAERSGVSIPTISRAERGQLALGYENFSALAKALRIDIGALFSEAGAEDEGLQPLVIEQYGEIVRPADRLQHDGGEMGGIGGERFGRREAEQRARQVGDQQRRCAR